MGQEILYCYKCQTRLLGSEFEKGKAFKVGGKASCADCVKELIASIPEAPIEVDRKISSSSRIRAIPPDPSKVKPPTLRPGQPVASAPARSRVPFLLAILVGVIVVAAVALMMNSSRQPADAPANNTSILPPPPPPPKPENSSPPPPSGSLAAELREIDEMMRSGLANGEFRQVADFLDAARKRRSTPEWLNEVDLRIPQVESRARRAASTFRDQAVEAHRNKDAAQVKSLRDKVAAWGFPAVVDEFDRALAEPAPPTPPAPPPIPGSTEAALVLYDDVLAPFVRNYSWSSTVDFNATSPVFEGARSIAFTPTAIAAGMYLHPDVGIDTSRYPFVTFAIHATSDPFPVHVVLYGDGKPNEGLNLHQLGGAPAAGTWKRYVVPVSLLVPGAKKITGFVVQAFQVTSTPLLHVDSVAFLKTAESSLPPTHPPSPLGTSPPKPAAELDGYRARWSQAAAKASQRDYAAAQRELEDAASALKDDAAKAEAAADLDLIKLAAQVPVEAAKAIEKWPKGQKLRLEFLNGNGERDSVDGTLIGADATRISVLRETPVDLPVCELLPASLAELFRGRSEKKPTDARAAAAFCLFEGDLETGRRLWGESPEMPRKLASAAKARPEADAAVRRTFWAAEADFAAPKRRAAAIEKYSSMLAGEATPLGARLRPYVMARLDAARDTVFLADDLGGGGTFAMTGAGGKLDVFWTSCADTGASKAKENYVEAEFYLFPGAAYRAWVWAAACCLETFEFSVQVGDAVQPAKTPTGSLKKWHAQHGGPKEPAKWEWFPVTLAKLEGTGLRKLRVLTNQQGFSVGAIVISATRRDTPRDAEIKEIEKQRFGRRNANSGPSGFILYEYWLGIEGARVEELTKHPSFAEKPSGSSLKELFEGPKNFNDNFGARLRGYVHPPVGGAYTFWIASDDASELWLSSDDSPIRKRLIASVPSATTFREWTRHPQQKSAPMLLAAGKRYYIEALHKEAFSDDFISVGWTLPDGSEERPIPGSRLSAWGVATPAPTAVGNATFFRGYNLNGEATVIDGRRWEGKKSPQLAASGDGVENQSIPLNPPADDARTAMIRCSAFQKGSTVVKVYQVPAGTYLLYLYVWEDKEPQVFDLFVQNKEVIKSYNSGPAGHWEKLGPWSAAVGTDGILQVHSSGGDANLSGLEIWKPGK
jgi:hypothetical protein